MERDAGRLVNRRPPTHCHLPRVWGKSRKSNSLKRAWHRPRKRETRSLQNCNKRVSTFTPSHKGACTKAHWINYGKIKAVYCCAGCSHCRAIGEQERRELFTCRSSRGRQDVHTKKCPLTAGNRGEL